MPTIWFFHNLAIHCAAPPTANNLVMSNKWTHFNNTIKYKCNKGFIFDENTNDISIHCQANEQWNQTSIPDCTRKICLMNSHINCTHDLRQILISLKTLFWELFFYCKLLLLKAPAVPLLKLQMIFYLISYTKLSSKWDANVTMVYNLTSAQGHIFGFFLQESFFKSTNL